MTRHLSKSLALLGLAFASDRAFAEAAAKSANVAVRLVSEVTAIQPGKPFTVALHMKMAPKWHTYWKNPGDSGMPTRIVWTLPETFKAGELRFPAPMRAIDGGLALYGYEHEVTFLTEITPSVSLPAGKFTVSAKVSWLECSDICIPGKATLDLALPLGNATGPATLDSAEKALFGAARASMPQPLPGLKASAADVGGQFVLKLAGASGLTAPIEFFPEISNLIEAAQPQTASKAGNGWEVRVKRPSNAAEIPAKLNGVVVSGTGASRKAYSVTVNSAIPAAKTVK